jgi:hypothetical protein
MISEVVKNMLEMFTSGWLARRRLRFTVHRAWLVNSSRECFFLNATNLSRDREIEITHIWFDSQPQVPVIQPDRPLPKRIRPDETWETWIEVSSIPTEIRNHAHKMARARLSTGKVYRSVLNRSVGPAGEVPCGTKRNT